MNYFLNPAGGLTAFAWTLLALVPPAILALYFLKLRRKSVEVPSTFLWHRTVEDLQVNSLWQRLRSSVLLWLQMIAAILLILTCLRPGCQEEKTIGARFIIGIDTSASSQTKDTEKGTRLQDSISQALDFVEGMKPNDQAMVITISDKAKIRQSYTNNKMELREKLANITSTNHRTDVDELFRLASGIATPSEISEEQSGELTAEQVQALDESKKATLMFFSDGRFKNLKDINLGHLAVDFFPVGDEQSGNVGIVSFNAKPMQKKKRNIEIFYRVENFFQTNQPVELELFRDGELIDAVRVTLKAGEVLAQGFEDDLTTFPENIVKYQLKVKAEDKFQLDNVADCVINPNPIPKVLLVSEGDGLLERAMSSRMLQDQIELQVEDSSFLETAGYEQACKNNVYRLVVFDRVTPKRMPLSNTMFWGTLPPEGWKAKTLESPVFVLDSDDTHPLMMGINVTGLVLLKCNQLEGPERTKSLWESDNGPIVSIVRREVFQDLVFGFSLSVAVDDELQPNTDWHIVKTSFPLFIHRTLEYLAGLGSVRVSSTTVPGKPFRFQLPADLNEATIEFPNGNKTPIKTRGNGQFLFYQTDQVGVYKVLGKGDEHLLSFAVALNDREESKIALNKTIGLGFEEVKAETGRVVKADSQFWKILLLSGFVVLLVEWYFYHRRSIM